MSLPSSPAATGVAVPAEADLAVPTERQAVWSRYWAHGAEHSCGGSYAGRYGGEIARFWHQRLADLPAATRVLDLATGNGALPRLLLDACPAAGVVCDAVDLADVQPAWLAALPMAQRERLRFHCGCAAESLPFDNARFDRVISQYGLEYTDLGRSLPELLRVLAPGGQVALVLHHSLGRPVGLAAVEIEHIDWLQSPAGLLETTRQLLPSMAQAGTAEGRAALAQDGRAHALRAAFNALQGELKARAEAGHGDGADVLYEARDATAGLFPLAARQGAETAQAAWHGVQQWLRDSRLRLRELRSHALDAARVQALAERLSGDGTDLQVGILREHEHVMGWTVHGQPGGR